MSHRHPQSQSLNDFDSDSDADLALSPLIPDLSDDIAARCIALLPLSSHPSLSLVSRSWRSLLRPRSQRRNDFIFNLRSTLRLLEPFIVLSVRSASHPSLWFLLHPRRRRGAHHLPSPPIPTAGAAAVALGPTVYLLGGSHGNLPTRAVQILHPRLRRWSLGPSMLAARQFPAAAAISGQVYVAGGCLPQSPHWAESLGLNSWSPLSSPAHLRDKWMHGHAVLNGKMLAVADRGGVLFDPVTSSWGPVTAALDLGWKGRAAVVGSILYTYDHLGKIKGYDPSTEEWKQVEGLEGELPRFLYGATLADVGGHLCLVWEGKVVWEGKATARVEISCAGIKISSSRLEKDGGGLRLKGEVVWLEEAVLAMARGSTIAHCIAVEL